MHSLAVSLARLAAFIIFGLLCVAVARAQQWETRRRRVLALFAYVVLIQLVIGISQKDSWPFTPYRMMHGIANLDVDLWRVSFYGVDDSGREWRVDPYAWEAIPDWHLQLWVVTAFKKLPPEQKQQTVEILFAQAERYRAATISRGRLPYPSFLGPFSAAQLWMFDREAAVSPNPYRGFRIYREDWTGRSRMAKPPVDKRVLIAERGRI
jgi:hypothetical protein